jgi:hypothetical protein
VPTLEAVRAAGGVPGSSEADWAGWLEGERALVAGHEAAGRKPVLADLCARFDFDAVLIDAGEFMGWPEWVIVRDQCRPRFVALHDTNTFKTRAALAEIG